ncbi:MAG: PilW family protein [Sterolibacterium sp.]|nr:PilW family protein [Sterolibacterium sp.]
MFSFPISCRLPRCSSGFSLVEIMVGMVIGMLGIIVMMQIFALAEGQKRSTTGGGDAQNTGAIALYGLQRDIRQAGWGNSELRMIGCDVLLRPGVTLSAMAPLTISHAAIPAGDANTDTLLVVYGNTNGTTQGDGITGPSVTATSYPVQTPTAYAPNDYVIPVPQTRPTPCSLSLMQVDSTYVGNAASPNLTLKPVPPLTSMPGGTLYHMGQSPKILAYAIRNSNLTVCDYTVNDCAAAGNTGDAAIWVPIASNIVSLRAQYGRDTLTVVPASPPTPLPSYVVDTYDQTTPTTACGWVRTSAVRLALVARSGVYEKTAVTTAAPAWQGNAGAPVVLTANANWQNYRYKVFQTVVPIRNIAWLGVQVGC